MLLLKTIIACLAVGAAIAVLQWSGVAPHEHDSGTPDAKGGGCRFCPSTGACLSAQPEGPACTNQEERS